MDLDFRVWEGATSSLQQIHFLKRPRKCFLSSVQLLGCFLYMMSLFSFLQLSSKWCHSVLSLVITEPWPWKNKGKCRISKKCCGNLTAGQVEAEGEVMQRRSNFSAQISICMWKAKTCSKAQVLWENNGSASHKTFGGYYKGGNSEFTEAKQIFNMMLSLSFTSQTLLFRFFRAKFTSSGIWPPPGETC